MSTNTSTSAEPERRRAYGRDSRARVKHGKHKKRFPVFLIILILIVILGSIVIGGEVLRRIMPSSEKADLQELYGKPEGYAAVMLNHSWQEDAAVWDQEHVYLAYHLVRDELKGRFFWDSQDHKLLYTFPTETMTADADTRYNDVPVFTEREDEVYILLDYVTAYTDVDAEVFSDPQRVILSNVWEEEQFSIVKSDTEVRVKGGIKSPIVTEPKSGDKVIILEQMENWTKVYTPNGWIGYLPNSSLGSIETETPSHVSVEPEYQNLSVDYDICYVWQQSLYNSAISQLETLVASESAMKSATTVGPTWFSITDDTGSIRSNASIDYTNLAHQNSLDVWPVLENVNNPEVDITSVLNSTANRSHLVKTVMSELESSGADGLNIDLENIPVEAGDGYIQLIREFSVECRKKGLILSVDDPVPSAWTSYYNRREQGIVADYVIIMNYDEHYKGSEAGSTASLPYVEEAIQGTKAEVPAEKVVNGVPFYTRLWKATPELDSEAIGMDGAAAFVAEHNGTLSWDENLGQNYVRIEEGSSTYEIWMEDADSMRARLQYVEQSAIAGIACWKQGMEIPEVWDVIAEFYS